MKLTLRDKFSAQFDYLTWEQKNRVREYRRGLLSSEQYRLEAWYITVRINQAVSNLVAESARKLPKMTIIRELNDDDGTVYLTYYRPEVLADIL